MDLSISFSNISAPTNYQEYDLNVTAIEDRFNNLSDITNAIKDPIEKKMKRMETMIKI